MTLEGFVSIRHNEKIYVNCILNPINPSDVAFDKIRKIRPLLDLLLERWKYIIVHQKIPFQERLGFCQYIRNKRHKSDIEVYKLCINNEYTYSISVYCGQCKAISVPRNRSNHKSIEIEKTKIPKGKHSLN